MKQKISEERRSEIKVIKRERVKCWITELPMEEKNGVKVFVIKISVQNSHSAFVSKKMKK